MIFYKNEKKHKKATEKNLIFSVFADGIVSDVDDLVAKPNVCKTCYNLVCKDGALKTGMGFSDFTAPNSEDALPETFHAFNYSDYLSQIDGIWLDRWFNTNVNKFKYQVLIYDDESKIIWGIPLIDEYEGYVWKRKELPSKPISQMAYRIENNDVSLFFTKDGMAYLGYNYQSFHEDVPALISGVVHYDKFFGITNTNRNTLIYTSNLDLTTWSEAENSTIEFLDNRGAFVKLVAFNDYVYLFREHGITKLSIYSSKDDFSVTHLYTSTSRIYENSVCVCGDKVFFVTRDGLYTFNGSSVNRVGEQNDKYFRYLDNTNCSAVCLKGKYYFASRFDFDDDETVGCESQSGYVNNVLFEIDVETYDTNVLRGVDVQNIIAIDCHLMCKLCASFNTQNNKKLGELNFSGKDFVNVLPKCWQSYKTDMNYRGKRKKIKEIVIDTLYDCDVEIVTDEETKTYSFTGSEKEQRLPVCVYGKTMQFIFKTDKQDCQIRKPMIVFDVVE